MIEFKNASFTWQESGTGQQEKGSDLARIDRQTSEDDTGSQNSTQSGCQGPSQDLVGINLMLRKVRLFLC